MMINRLVSAIEVCMISFTLFACESRMAFVTTHTPLQLGNITVDLVLHEAATPGLTYFNLHDNENTSVAAALDIIGEYGGRVVELKHSGDRNITFLLDDTIYEFDPNRMFSEKGRIATLERFSNATDDALDAVGAFADEVLQQLKVAELDRLVTLHNTPPSSYSVFVYTIGGDLEKEAEITFVTEDMDPNDFYFVTDRVVFEQLRQLGHNVVLQDNSNVTDDGSLSVWSAQHNLLYVNVEAQNGHRREQVDMLMHLHEILFAGGEAGSP